MLSRSLALALFILAAPTQAAETFGQLGPSRSGRIDFVFVGASMADNRGLANGVNCIKPSATATVRRETLPLGPKLLSATLYLGGSLIDDGEDYPGLTIFHSEYTFDTAPAAVTAAALAATPRSVDFRPPGAAAALTVAHDDTRDPYTSILYKPYGPEAGNLAFFLTPIDVTQVILEQGGGVLAGDYEVSGLLADVCYGAEVACSSEPDAATCATNPGSAIHTNGAASFALLLVFEDPSLPQRSVTIYEGLKNISGKHHTERLLLDSPVSNPASGALSVYGLEGDLLLPFTINPSGACLVDEYIEVDGDAFPDADGLCLADDDNQLGNIFNGTINSDPRDPDGLVCPDGYTQDFHCCYGDGLCGVVGVDIDRFNISPALTPGANTVRVTMGSGSDEFYVAALVLGVDVFAPTLALDTQIRVLDADLAGNIRIGGLATYSIAVSNTGNIAATSVNVTLDAPAGVTDFTVQRVPNGATDLSSGAGTGQNGTGRIDVQDFNVEPGKVAEIRFTVRLGCEVGRALYAGAQVTADELLGFSVAAPPLVMRGPSADGSVCPAADENGPFAPREDLSRVLRGGGGCSAVGSLGILPALLLLLPLAWRRRRRRTACLFMLALAITSCARKHKHTEPTPEGPLTSLEDLPGESCGTALMVTVTRADGTRFCIDRFEASLDEGELGLAHQGGADDLVLTTDGSTTAVAKVELGLAPARNVSWYQASAACQNAGKRLCTTAEWELACRGAAASVYPYGEEADETICNGFFAYTEGERIMPTGSFPRCVSGFGAYDMSGNIEEWTASATARVPGSDLFLDRDVRGGGYNANATALACAGPEFHAAPATALAERGFRCCSDLP